MAPPRRAPPWARCRAKYHNNLADAPLRFNLTFAVGLRSGSGGAGRGPYPRAGTAARPSGGMETGYDPGAEDYPSEGRALGVGLLGSGSWNWPSSSAT